MPRFRTRKEIVGLVDGVARTEGPVDPALVRRIDAALQARYPVQAVGQSSKQSTGRNARTLIEIDENTAAKQARGCFLVLASLMGLGGLFVGWYINWHSLFKRPASDEEERSRLRASNLCWKCGYPVQDLPAAIEPSRIGGLVLGPLHCPECGVRWPLLP